MTQCSDALTTKFEDAKSLLAEIAGMMDREGFELEDIHGAMSQLYEAETHLRPATTITDGPRGTDAALE